MLTPLFGVYRLPDGVSFFPTYRHPCGVLIGDFYDEEGNHLTRGTYRPDTRPETNSPTN